MQGMIDRIPTVEFDIYTQTAKPFFDNSLSKPISYFDCRSDVGLLQSTPLQSDINGSLPVINDFLDSTMQQSVGLAKQLRSRAACLVICDISPLGLLAAAEAGVPSVLVENFTWDWIYEDFLSECPAYKSTIARMREINSLASYRVKTQPLCDEGGRFELKIGPLCRRPLRSIESVRESLGLTKHKKLVLLTLGGIAADNPFLERLKTFNNVYFLITGSRTSKKEDNIYQLKNDASVYLADHLNACDAVIGKLGYSTVAETWAAGLPMMYITRDDFRESAKLANFADTKMQSIALSEQTYASGEWLSRVETLLSMQRKVPMDKYDALDRFADFVIEQILDKQ